MIDTVDIPGDNGQLRLIQRGAEFSIMLGSNELMNSRLSGSEEALATLSCQRLAGRARPRILIGGLGMGFTLRAALSAVTADAEITVAELLPAVIAWARGPMAAVFGDCLVDPRVDLVEADVGVVLKAARSAFDAILLDVDNGPDGLTRKSNDRLYDSAGLAVAWTALRPGGILSVWSSGPDKGFTKRLVNAGFVVEERGTRANRSGGGARHVIWMATRPVA